MNKTKSSKGLLILRDKNFLMLWLSQLLSQTGSRMFQIATVWWIISQEQLVQAVGQNTFLTAFLVLSALPAILFVNPIGQVIEYSKRKKILQYVDFLGLLTSSLLLFLNYNDQAIWGVIALCLASFVYSTLMGFIEPALMKLINEVVPPEDIPSAVGFITSTQTLAAFFGAVLGAMLIEAVSLEGIILLNGLSYLISLVLDSLIKVRFPIDNPVMSLRQNDKGERESSSNILAGMPAVRSMVRLFAMVNLFMAPLTMMIALYTKSELNGDGSTLGLMEAAIMGGILIGTMGGASWFNRVSIEKLLSATIAVFGLSLVLPAIFVNSWIYGLALLVSGVSVGLVNFKLIAYFQMAVEDQMKGRFFAIVRAMATAMIPLGYLLFGFLSSYFSAAQLTLLQGIALVMIAFAFLSVSRKATAASYAEGEV